MSDRKWQRSSLRRVAEQLAEVGYRISQTTLRRLLEDMKYSLKANEKRLAGSSHPDRERQFEYIARQKRSFAASGMPIISVDTKKKELIGNFKNPGQTWRQTADAVNDHDFEQDALGKAVPYGIYDLKHNRGYGLVKVLLRSLRRLSIPTIRGHILLQALCLCWPISRHTAIRR